MADATDRVRSQELRTWRGEIERLRVELAADCGNLNLAVRIWSLVGKRSMPDVRSAALAVGIFHSVAIRSDEGLTALLFAFKEMHDDLGEIPSAELFDPPLENAIRKVACGPVGECRERAIWLLECIDE